MFSSARLREVSNTPADGLPRHEPEGAGTHERCLFSSVLALGALFGLMASPAMRTPMAGVFLIVGVPLLTFLVAAPSRLGLFSELRLFVADTQAAILGGLCLLVGRRAEARAVVAQHRANVERTYGQFRLAPLVAADPLRLHHARRVGMMGALLAVLAGVGLPFIASDTYTFGDFPTAPLVFLIDVVAIGLAARIVSERIGIRLFEASTALRGGSALSARLRTVPLTAMLGAALGAVGGLLVLVAAAVASGIESVLVFDADFARSTIWFLGATALSALPMGLGIGAVLGVSVGLAQGNNR